MNILVLQSGGPTAVINSSLVGIIKEAKKNNNINKIYGSIYGLNGIFNNEFVDLGSINEADLEIIKYTPAAYLGSARHQLPMNFDDDEYIKILSRLIEYNVGYILVIGGNDSMDTVDKLSKYFNYNNIQINVIGVPKTIDNDLIMTDHCPGYGSSVKYIAGITKEVRLDTSVYENGRVTIMEVMGRDAGWLTAGCKLAGELAPDLIYLPEVAFDIEKFLEDVNIIYQKNKKVLVAISEGIRDKNGEYILNSFKYIENNDVFGHQQLGGAATVLAEMVKLKLGLPVRSFELNLPQRCAGHMLSKTDIDEAYKCGINGVRNVITKTGKFIYMERTSDYLIKYKTCDVCEVANKVKTFPLEWIIDGNNISEEYINYALPLIKGEIKLDYENGLPKYLVRKNK